MTKEAFDKIAGGLNEALERVTLPASEESYEGLTDGSGILHDYNDPKHNPPAEVIPASEETVVPATEIKIAGWFNPWNDYHGYQQVSREREGKGDTIALCRHDEATAIITKLQDECDYNARVALDTASRLADALDALTATREQAVRECAEKDAEITKSVERIKYWSSDAKNVGFADAISNLERCNSLAKSILSLSQVRAKK